LTGKREDRSGRHPVARLFQLKPGVAGQEKSMLSSVLVTMALALPAPPASPSLQAVHILELPTRKPRECISIMTGQGMVIVLARSNIERVMSRRSSRAPKAQKRFLELQAQRADALLKGTTEHRDALGCLVNNQLIRNFRPSVQSNWLYVVFALFKEGEGRVWDPATSAFLKKARLVDDDEHCGEGPAGFEMLETLRGEILASVQTCFR
jgi:hypothetical protein